MLQTSLLLMKSLNKTDTPIFLSVVCSLFPKAIFVTFIYIIIKNLSRYSMKYTTMSLILGSEPPFAVLTISSILQIMVSLGVPHELFYALSIKNMSQIRKI